MTGDVAMCVCQHLTCWGLLLLLVLRWPHNELWLLSHDVTAVAAGYTLVRCLCPC